MTRRGRALLAQALNLSEDDLAGVTAALLARADDVGLARAGAAWWQRLAELSAVDPRRAGELAHARWSMLAAYRPESPAPLDAAFAPTEAVPSSAPGSAP